MINEIKAQAEIGKFEYKTGLINREEAKEKIQPFIDAFNAKSKEVAKKYNQRPRLITLASYLR